jgi:uncharacterized protein with von Willebrand factor type A (vWA) domain
MLENRDYTLIIDRSGSMSSSNQPEGKSRWASVQESTLALARQCEELDSDGLTVYLFSHRFRRYRHMNSSQVERLFQDEDNTPQGGTNLSSVLQDALNHYFERKAYGQSKPNGETIIVITDGVPNDRLSVADVILKASQRMDRDEELAICFIQVGSDPTVTRFLKSLDDQLKGIGAKFDIVDTITMEDMEDMTLTEVLLNAIVD